MTITSSVVSHRLRTAADLLREEDLELLLVAPAADMRYLLGYASHASERPTLLAVPAASDPFVLVAGFEAPGFGSLDEVGIVTYEETEDPYVVLRDALASTGGFRGAAINEQAWAGVLLRLQRTFPDVSFVSADALLARMRVRKGPEELDLLRRAAAMADTAFGALITTEDLAGRAEREVAATLTALLKEQGLETASWGPIVGSGPNGASPHHITGDRVIQQGDAIVLDFGGTLGGYGADITRTVHVGEADDEFRHVYEVVRQAQQAAVDAVWPGAVAEEVDRAARRVIEAAGYGAFFIHRTGHGIGLDEHEEPYIVAGNAQTLEAGMTFSIEPGIYLPGRFGVRIEDIVSVTDDGARRLNEAPRELTIVG